MRAVKSLGIELRRATSYTRLLGRTGLPAAELPDRGCGTGSLFQGAAAEGWPCFAGVSESNGRPHDLTLQQAGYIAAAQGLWYRLRQDAWCS